jgi:hypothetical protein
VTVQTLAPYQRGPSTIVPIRWFINDAGDGRPVLDANIEFGPAQTDATTLLLLVGTARSHIDHGHPENGHHHQVSRTIARTFLTTLARLQFPGPFPRSQPTP